MHLAIKATAFLIAASGCVAWANDSNQASTTNATKTTIASLVQKVEEGDTSAMNALGNMYLHGDGVSQNGEEAIRLFKKAVELGSADGAMNLGRAFFRGRGIQSNAKEATEWFKTEINMREKRLPASAALGERDTPLGISSAQITPQMCKIQVLPDMPKGALVTGKGGEVRAQALIIDGKVRDVSILSGPRPFQDKVAAAMMQYQCESAPTGVLATQEFAFNITDNFGRAYLYRVEWNDKWSRVAQPTYNADWSGLTNAQRRQVRARYGYLPSNYEPPYPVHGTGSLAEDIRVFAEHWGWKGKFSLEVTVNSKGVATNVNVFEGPTEKARQYAAAVAFNASYKPGKCDDKPCDMVFPLDIEVVEVASDSSSRDSMEKRAENGDPASQNAMGERYEYGRGVNSDFGIAVTWYRKSAAQGFLDGQNNLARMLEAGRGLTQNYAEALSLYRSAAERGHAPSQNNYGYMLASGSGTPVNLAEAAKWFDRSAQQGYALAQINLGDAYVQGQGVAADIPKAIDYFQRAFDSGRTAGAYRLTLLNIFGFGETAQREELAQLILAKARTGDVGAITMMGLIHAHGTGVAKDDGKALQMFAQAADKGNGTGQLFLASSYDEGRGTPANTSLARTWYERAAARGNPIALMRLAEIYDEGRGVPKDPQMARTLEAQARDKKYSAELDDIFQMIGFNRVAERDAKQKLVRYREVSANEAIRIFDKIANQPWDLTLPGSLSLITSKPALSEPMSTSTSLSVTLKFDVADFKEQTLFIVPRFESTTPGITVGFKDPERIRFPWLATQTGTLTLSIPISEVLQISKIKQPLRMRFLLLRLKDAKQTTLVAETEAVSLMPFAE